MMMVMESNQNDETQKSKDGELRHDGMGGIHADFNLKSSDSQPFDSARMSGKPVGSDNGSEATSSSQTQKKSE